MRPPAIKPVSVLVVDGSALIRRRLRALLAEDDHIRWVGQVASRAEAWTLFDQIRPEAVLLDLRLPDGGGLELLCRIKQATPFCLVIVLTNFRESIFRHESHRCGADYFLHKSTEFDQVANLLHHYATQRNPQDSALRTPTLKV